MSVGKMKLVNGVRLTKQVPVRYLKKLQQQRRFP